MPPSCRRFRHHRRRRATAAYLLRKGRPTNRRGHRLKIVSGGQTGVDRAALDAALEVGLPCGGWCPRGRLAEDGPIAERYPLCETPSEVYAERTEWNVRDADATLVLTVGAPHGGTALTVDFLRQYRKPHRIVDLDAPERPDDIAAWIRAGNFASLNVAGPRENQMLGVYTRAKDFLVRVFERYCEGGTHDRG